MKKKLHNILNQRSRSEKEKAEERERELQDHYFDGRRYNHFQGRVKPQFEEDE